LAPPEKREEPRFREFTDSTATRDNIYEKVLQATQGVVPVSNNTHTLRLSGVEYTDPPTFSRAKQKEAILDGRTLTRRMRGTWELLDNETGKVVDKRKQVVARVPFFSSRGTFIHNGNEYTLSNQQRLRSGVFTRIKDNGEIEAHANLLPGKGSSHRYFLDPAKGVFYIKFGQARMPLMPLLKAMGVNDKQLQEAWGKELYATNYAKGDSQTLTKLKARLLRRADIDDPNEDNSTKALVDRFLAMELDPEVTTRTLGEPYKNMTADVMLATTKKLLAVSRGESDVDDRDHLAYQTFLGPEDLFSERISRDHDNLQRTLLYKNSFKGDLSRMPSSALQPQLEAALLGSGLGQSIEEINPAEILDKQTRITRMGTGGIPSLDAVPIEARGVQPSHMGYMDPLRTPESFRVGVDVYMARGARKGRDGKIYAKFLDSKTGKRVWRTPQQVADLAVGFPGTMKSKDKRVPAMMGGKMAYVPRKNVALELESFEDAFSPIGNMVPLKSMLQGQRAMMASRMLTQALPLKVPETPWVQSAIPGTGGKQSFEGLYSGRMGAIKADKSGRVVSTKQGIIKAKYDDGTSEEIDLYHNFPFNRKTYIHQTPLVKPGDRFKKGHLLAKSNYTDEQGRTALGLNAKVAYIPWKGLNFEDAIVVSEGFATRSASEHMYQHEVEMNPQTKIRKRSFVSLFPGKFDKQVLSTIDDTGVVKEGTEVNFGDPLILTAKERERSQNKIHRKRQAGYEDRSILWDHHDAGVVTDVFHSKKGPVVLVKATSTTQVGDKLSGRFGDKGVISAVIPDSQMPHSADGTPFEVLLNPLGVISRRNPAQLVEAVMGRIAKMEGKPINIPDFEDISDMTEFALSELRKRGLDDLEGIIDPENDRKISDVFTGNRFFVKLHHTAESKGQARGGGGYTQEGSPAKGGKSGAKRISLLDTNALLSHGATATLRDAGAIRGQRNEEYWLQFMRGFNPRAPRVPFVYEKFVNQLKAAGINVNRKGSQTNIMALTDKDVAKLAGNRVITSGETVRFDKGLAPIPGGLFDPAITGGHNGTKWSAIKLMNPLPNPAMEEPIRRILGLTKKDFESVISGSKAVNGISGPAGISSALENLNIPKEIALSRVEISQGSKTNRDRAVHKLGYLKTAQRLDLNPKDWMLSRVPVLPPAFRPVSVMGDKGIPLVSDPNYLYRDLVEATNNHKEMVKEVGKGNAGAEQLAVYQTFKAVTGLGDPITTRSQEKSVKGILRTIFGTSPKLGTVQRRLISSTVDNVGRAVITPNPDLDMDQVGLPEERAFDVYSKFVVRRLRRKGLPISKALQSIKDRSPVAREALVEEMESRPVIINRAPVLHKFGILAFHPQLVTGDTLQVSPLIVGGFGADFDGDAMQYHVPTSEDARKEAIDRLLPSKALLSPADFKTPVHMPSMEYVGGLYHATSKKSRRRPRVFRNKADVIQAYRRGELGVDDSVETMQ
jgi:DNA-directed RNA polymerase subunit beta